MKQILTFRKGDVFVDEEATWHTYEHNLHLLRRETLDAHEEKAKIASRAVAMELLHITKNQRRERDVSEA